MKKSFALLIAMALLFCIAGCASGGESVIDLDALDAALAEKAPFIETLEPIDSDLGCMICQLDEADCEKAIFRFSSGATAEEVVLIKAKDKDALKRIEKVINDRLAFQKDSFANYIPSEVPKIESAIIKTSGNYLVYCVADDLSAAQDVIDLYFR